MTGPPSFGERFFAEKIGDFLHKYIIRNPNFSSEAQHRCYQTISDLICSGFGGVWQIAGVHGGGSPIMETIWILSSYDLEARKKIAKELAGIKD